MKKIFIIIGLMFSTYLSAASTLAMSEAGGIKIVSTDCINTTCQITLSPGSQLFFNITNNTNKDFVLTKFEIISYYNDQPVLRASTTDSAYLSGDTFGSNEYINLGYTLSASQVANYWIGKYYLTDKSTGEKFTNSLKWNNDLTPSYVVTEAIIENVIHVSNTSEFREALTTAASDGQDDIILLADGIYKTTDDGLGTFRYSSSQANKLTIKGSSAENVILSGENTNRVLYLYNTIDGTSINIENISVENGYVDDDGAGIWSNRDLYIDYTTVRNNEVPGANRGGGLFLYNVKNAHLYLKNSLIENNRAYLGGGFYVSNLGANSEIRNSIIRNNTAKQGGGFYSGYTQVYNSIISSNIAEGTLSYSGGGAFYGFFSLSLVNSLVINNSTGILTYSGDANYVVNSILSHNGFYDYKTDGASSANIINSYTDGNLSITHFDSNVITSGTLGFLDEVNGDYSLTADSVLIDMGSNDPDGVILPDTDYEGNARIAGGSIDIGPYEFSTTRPTIYSITYTGTAKEFSELAFNVSYTLSDGRAVSEIAYDYLNNGSFTTVNTHTFNTAGTYTVNAKVTDSEGEHSTTSIEVVVAVLPFSDMTDEQKLQTAIDPVHYDAIMAIIEAEKESARLSGITVGENNVVLNPAEFGLVTATACTASVAEANTTGIATGKEIVISNPESFGINVVAPLTNADISNLSAGWNMIAITSDITDMGVFTGANIVWYYKDSTWFAYSANATTASALTTANIGTITTLPANSAVWVEK